MKTKLMIPFLLLFAACTSDRPMTDEQKAAVKEEASVVVKDFFDALIVNDIEKIMDSYEYSEDFNFVGAGDVYTSDVIAEVLSQYLPLLERQTVDLKYEQYVIVDPSCFIYTWHGSNGMYMKSGDSTIIEDYFGTYGFRKHKDGWKLFFGHESYEMPVPIDTTTAG